MKVLVAVDDSDGSSHALAWVLDHFVDVVQQQPRSTLVLVHAYEPLHHVMYPVGPASRGKSNLASAEELIRLSATGKDFLATAGELVRQRSAVYGATSMMESVRAAQAENARNILDRAKRICHQRGVSAEAVAVEGEPREAVCFAAADMGVGLLVVGSRGLGAIKRAFLGSVSDYCAHHATCPIMVVKPPRDDEGHSTTN